MSLLVGACTDKSSPTSTTPASASSTQNPSSTVEVQPDKPGVVPQTKGVPTPRLFEVKLTQGSAPAEVATALTVSTGNELSPAKVQELTAKLPAWDDPASLGVPFAYPVQSSPPPRPGKTVVESFPPANADVGTAPGVDSGPLQVLRVQPEGDVPLAPYVAITFNQPMVPVGTVSQLAAIDVPVTINPAVPGRWQWIGARTLRFDAATDAVDRLPMATKFTVTVPAGTKSANGTTLAAAATFTFATPAPKVETFFPQGDTSMGLEPVFVALFDQRIDQSAVLRTISARANNEPVALRLATAAEIAADERSTDFTKNAQPGRWIAFVATSKLTPASSIDVSVGPATPSAEGPLTTTSAESFSNRTYGPLKIQSTSCDSNDGCQPGGSISISFTNPLKPGPTDAAKVTVSPQLAAQEVVVDANGISILGFTKARTKYTITLPGSLTDIYGQTLGSDQTRTVQVSSAQKWLRQLEPITILDPFAEAPKLSLLTTNFSEVRVRVFAADPTRFSEYATYAARRDEPDAKLPNWKVLSDQKVQPKGEQDVTIETLIDLSKELGGKPGQVIVLVDPVPSFKVGSDQYYENRPSLSWVQSTTIGADAFIDDDDLQVWATDLRTGAPLKGISVVTATGESSTTNELGLATSKLPQVVDGFDHVVVSRGIESVILPISGAQQVQTDSARWYVFDDRQIYRPSETISIKGWVRRVPASTDDLTLLSATLLNYIVTDAVGQELTKGVAKIGSLGGFDFALEIPKTANLGTASIQLIPDSNSQLGYQHSFQIADFRRPEFEVTVQPVSPAPFLSTGSVTMETQASYLAGGSLPNAPVSWNVSTSESTFSPAGWNEFTFGIFQPWWWIREVSNRSIWYPSGLSDSKTYQATTDENGKHLLQLDFTTNEGVLPDLPVSVSVAGTVTDVNRQAWSDQQNLLVHSADRYVGLRSDRSFVREGEPMKIEAVVTDIDGKVQVGSKISVIAGLIRSKYVNDKWVDEVVDPQTCDVTSAAEPVLCTFSTPVGGQYRVETVVTDAKGGRNRTQLTVWVSGAGAQPTRGVAQGTLTVVPDKTEYAPGDIAKILVQAPFAVGEGLAVITHNGIKENKRFTLEKGSAELAIALTEADIPNTSVTIEVVGASDRTATDGTVVAGAPKRPAFAGSQLSLPVPAKSRTLNVVATPVVQQLAPGESTKIGVAVTDATGAPVSDAEFAVVVVDEAVLGLTNYQLVDPISQFYLASDSNLSIYPGREQVRLVEPETLVPPPNLSQPGAGVASDEQAAPTAEASSFAAEPKKAKLSRNRDEKEAVSPSGQPVDVRTNFDALALFQPTVRTDASGKATVDVTLPDNLTRYRVMVVAVSGTNKFGTGESNLTARLPLGVRPSAPRFLNVGDQFEFPVVVQNNNDKSLAVDVVLQTANLDSVGSNGRSVTVPAGDRVEVRFPVKVRAAGTARFRATVFGANATDSVENTIPVFTPASSEAFATYGVIDTGAVKQSLLAPTDVFDNYGGLEITTSSTSLQGLTDALLYVNDYRYDSADGYASRIISIGSLRNVLKDFGAEGLPTEQELNDAVQDNVAQLLTLQNDDGGFRYWSRADRTDPYVSVQAAHALLLAKQSGYNVSQTAVDRTLEFLNNIESAFPEEYGEQERNTVKAYAIWVLALADRRNPTKAAELLRSNSDGKGGSKLTLDALAWIWGSLDVAADKATVERIINNNAVDTAGAVSFSAGYADGQYLILQSDRRTDAIVLDSLIANAPQSDLIPKVVAGLLADRIKGRWGNIQENTFGLIAFKRYYDTYESVDPNFVAKVWLGQQYAGEKAFTGRTTDRSQINVPMSQLTAGGNRDVVLAKNGAGRLYYRIGLRYVPVDLQLDPIDRGFVVQRAYEAVDNKSDVTRDADGTWRIKPGAKVRIRLTMVAESQRTHVALVDPLPAGLEALNPTLAVTEQVVDDGQNVEGRSAESKRVWWWWNWYDFQQFRDDRSETFSQYLPAGVYDYSYVARATTPGAFVVPPARAEEMYAPETFGRTSTDKVIVG
jgi:alpha-2-macroglobulin